MRPDLVGTAAGSVWLDDARSRRAGLLADRDRANPIDRGDRPNRTRSGRAPRSRTPTCSCSETGPPARRRRSRHDRDHRRQPDSSRAPAQSRSPLLVLAAVEARRFALHPLFLICAGFMVLGVDYQIHADFYANKDISGLELSLGPAWLMGLGGMIVAYRLTRSTRRAEEAMAGVPSDEADPYRGAAHRLPRAVLGRCTCP